MRKPETTSKFPRRSIVGRVRKKESSKDNNLYERFASPISKQGVINSLVERSHVGRKFG